MNAVSNLEATILIIDDDPEQVLMLSAVLRKDNYKVNAVTESSRALELLEHVHPDLILLDIMMPGLNGFDLCKLIHNDPRYSSIPIIMITTLQDSEATVKAFSYGAYDYISKPIYPQEMLARINTHIKLKRKTELLEEVNKEIQSFNHIICHDLKSPLWSIQNLANFLNEEYAGNSDEIFQRFLLGLTEKAHEAVYLIDKLAELTKISSEPIQTACINFYETACEVCAELMAGYDKRNINIRIDDLPEVNGDRLLLKQLLCNAISNALKYTVKKDPAEIRIAYQVHAEEYLFTVSDNGAGFDMKYADRLFQMFQRLHSKKDFPGVGAGLAIAKKIVQRHNGRIWIQSEENSGTELCFTLPILTKK